MTLELKLLSKLEPHAKRIKDGGGNDFDYLPAVLLQLMEVQKRQIQQLNDAVQLLDSIKSTVVSVGVESKTHIAACESSAQIKIGQLEAALRESQTQIEIRISNTDRELAADIKDTQTQMQNSYSHLSEQIVGIASAHAGHATKINEGLSAINLHIESLGVSAQRSQVKFTRILIAGLVASTVMIGLAIAILLRH